MAEKYLKARVQILRKPYSYWVSNEATILKLGEFGLDTDNKVLKCGDGTSKWLELTEYKPGLNVDGSSILDGGRTTFDNKINPITLVLANEESDKFSPKYVPKKGEPVAYLNSNNLQGFKIGDGRRSFEQLGYTVPFDDVITLEVGETEDFEI